MKFLTSEEMNDLDKIKGILCHHFGQIRSIIRLIGGSRSFCFSINDFVVRFPKDKIVWRTMKREKIIIDTIIPHLTGRLKKKIHKIELIEGKIPFSYSKKIQGKICDNRGETTYSTLYKNLSDRQKKDLASSLAQFLVLTHKMDYKKIKIPKITETIDCWDKSLVADFNEDKVKNILFRVSNGKINLNDYQPKNINKERALCHNDLSGSNILIDPNKKEILQGIIDFGNACLMPKYQDFFPLYKINRELAINTLNYYNNYFDKKIELKQLDKMALSYIGYELLKSKNNEIGPYFSQLLEPFLSE